MTRIKCPFCLKPHDFNTSLECPEYDESVPPIYVREYRNVPPLWLVTVGFSRHGKTTYMAALTLILKQITRVLPTVYYRPLDQETMEAIQQMQREAMDGELPPPNPKGVARPLLFNVYDLPQSGSRCLVMYDVAGEVFNELNQIAQYVPAIRQVSTTWFLVSLDDLSRNQEGHSITDLFNAYLTGMESQHVDLKGRNLIVVYTKSDKLAFTPEIKNYLRSDPLQGLTLRGYNFSRDNQFSYNEYLEKMRNVSNLLEDYTWQHVDEGPAFINMVRANGMNLVFSVTSALGQDPDQKAGRLREDALRFRVLDPFFWALELEQPPSDKPFGLVVDASRQSRSVYDDNLLVPVWDMLANQGSLTTYYLGQETQASTPGQNPPSSPPHTSRLRLIGPILENAEPKTKVMAIVTGPILDLQDFYDTPWQNQLLLVMMGEEHQQNWPNAIVYRNGDSPQVLVDALLRL